MLKSNSRMENLSVYLRKKQARENAVSKLVEALSGIMSNWTSSYVDMLSVLSVFCLEALHLVSQKHKKLFGDLFERFLEDLHASVRRYGEDVEVETHTYLLIYRWNENEPFEVEDYGYVSVDQVDKLEAAYLREGGYDYIEAVRFTRALYLQTKLNMELVGSVIHDHTNN